MTLVVPDSDLGRTARLVISCTGTDDHFKLQTGAELKLDVPGGAPSVGPSTVFQAIAQASARGQELLGSTPEASAQVRPLARAAAELTVARAIGHCGAATARRARR
jgi:hypothetical protein